MAIPRERAFEHAANAVASNCRLEEIIVDLKDAGFRQDDVLWLVQELIWMRDDLRRAYPGQLVAADALLANWRKYTGKTDEELLASLQQRGRGKSATETRRKERAAEPMASKPGMEHVGPQAGQTHPRPPELFVGTCFRQVYCPTILREHSSIQGGESWLHIWRSKPTSAT